jgi:hypothetical protein
MTEEEAEPYTPELRTIPPKQVYMFEYVPIDKFQSDPKLT